MPILSLLVLTPFAAAVLVALLPSEPVRGVRRAALLLSAVPFALSLLLLVGFDGTRGDFQLVERARWIPGWGVEYHLGVDGISLFLVLLTTFLTPLVILACWGDVHVHAREFFVLMLLLESGMIGTFLALDLFLFYVFWEVMLIPMVLLIGIWGGKRRLYAAVKFMLFTMVGGLLMLVAILYCGWQTKTQGGAGLSFAYERFLALHLTSREQLWLFAAFALAFAVKVPLFPLHTWLPDAHVEAPTGGSVILAGVLLKMGTYGFLRFAIPLFPEAAHAAAPLLVALAVIGIVYGALAATVQPDVKKLVAYSSVSHLGFVVLGLFAFTPTAVAGSLYQMLNHGLSTGALFLLVGMVYERRHTRQIADFGGLWAIVPVYSTFLLIALLASGGLPGLNGFVGEFLILLGSFTAWPRATAVATSGVVLGALYLLWMYQRVIFGPVTHEENRQLTDLTLRERLVLIPVLVMCVVMGLYPAPFLTRMQPAIDRLLARVEGTATPATHVAAREAAP